MAYTTIDDPSAHFQTVLWTGNGSDDRSITFDGNSDMQPDMVWTKRRPTASSHGLRDSSRGATKELFPDDNAAELSVSDRFQAFESDGFQIGTNADINHASSNNTYVAWAWKANGGTTTTNDASATSIGSVDSVYQANTTAGFSIVTWTGTGSAGTIAHGLGATPQVVILKSRDNAHDWFVGHEKTHSTPWQKYLTLHSNGTLADDTIWNDTAPTSTVFSVGSYDSTNGNNVKLVAYCFTPIQGYSKFGSYTGNASDNGPFIFTGFKPKFAIFKAASASGEGWAIRDSARSPINQMSHKLSADVDSGEGTTADDNDCDFLSNGIKLRSNDNQMNKTGVTFVYMAFAEHPFVSSEGVPTTAR